jgi:hypothetical protein
MAERSGDDDVVVGCYCESPDGRIAKSIGWAGAERLLCVRFDGEEGSQAITYDEFSGFWKYRRDLKDFPDAKDPVLPSDFDLLYDVKRRSDLVALLGSGDEAGVRRAMALTGVVLTDAEEAEILAPGPTY